MPEESRFPIEFNECPSCGYAGKTVTRLGWEEEVEAGKISEASRDMPVAIRRVQLPLIDPKRGIVLTAAVLIYSYDVCSKCGREYCVRVDKQTGTVKIQQPNLQNSPRLPLGPDGFPYGSIGRG